MARRIIRKKRKAAIFSNGNRFFRSYWKAFFGIVIVVSAAEAKTFNPFHPQPGDPGEKIKKTIRSGFSIPVCPVLGGVTGERILLVYCNRSFCIRKFITCVLLI